MNRDTICVQGGYTPGNGEPRQIPIIQSTTFKYATSEDMGKLFDLEADGYFYSRLQNPTCDMVAKKICELEGGTAAMLTSSGQAANFFALFNICEAGDHIVASSTIYGGTFNLISVTMAKMGITATFGEGIIPDHRNLRCYPFDLINDITVAIYFQCIVFYIFLQEIRISFRSRHLFEFFRADRSCPTVGIYQFDIFLVVDHLIRKSLPLHKIDQMSRHIDYTFALLSHIKIPYRTSQRFIVDQLKQMMHLSLIHI